MLTCLHLIFLLIVLVSIFLTLLGFLNSFSHLIVNILDIMIYV
nr:MAG TPA: hypothetical protein [Caudoviricetes sp.]